MLHNRVIVICGDDWGRHPQTLEHMAKILAKSNRVIWVNSLGHRSPRFTLRDIRRMLEKLTVAIRTLSTDRTDAHSSGVRVVCPLGIPFHNFRFIRRINAWILQRLLLPILREMNSGGPILMVNSPVVVELYGKLNETVRVYYCLDDYPAFDGALRTMAELERRTLSKVDAAFFVSQHLYDSRLEKPKHSMVMSQGVNVEHFDVRKSSNLHPLHVLRRPIIGFMGWIAVWVDLDLIASCARLRPDWTFALIGSSAVDLTPYSNIPNMHFLGPIPFDDLPEYATSFDVGLIPFKVNPVTTASNPLKLLEYFSMGIPVVSTPLPEVEKLKPHVEIASSPEETIAAIERSLSTRTGPLLAERFAIARQHTWESVLERQCDLIALAEAEKTSK